MLVSSMPVSSPLSQVSYHSSWMELSRPWPCIPGSDDDLVAARRPLLRVHGAERWAVGPRVLEDRVLVERTGTVGRLPSTPQQCRDLVLDDLGQHAGGRPGLPVGAVIGLGSAGEDFGLDRLAGGVVHRAVLRAREGFARKRPEEAEDLAGHAAGEVPLVAVRRARGKDDLERRVRADRGGGEDLVDAELRAPLEADLAVRRGELGGPVHERHPVLGLTRCEQLVHDGLAVRSRTCHPSRAPGRPRGCTRGSRRRATVVARRRTGLGSTGPGTDPTRARRSRGRTG